MVGRSRPEAGFSTNAHNIAGSTKYAHFILTSVSARRALLGGVHKRRVERLEASGSVPKSFNKQIKRETHFVVGTEWIKAENTC
jgi:hypothetical protein